MRKSHHLADSQNKAGPDMKQAIAALLLACMPFAAAAQDASKVKDPILWGEFGTRTVQMEPGIGHACVIVSEFDTGHVLVFGRYFKPGKPGFFISVQNEKWKSLVHNKVYSISFGFGEKEIWEAESGAYVQGSTRRLTMKTVTRDFFDEFKSSKTVKMFYEGKEIAQLSLSGVQKAVEQMDACQQTTDELLKISRTEPDTSDPFAKKPSTQDPFEP
jgi:hypothetical protein